MYNIDNVLYSWSRQLDQYRSYFVKWV